MLRLQVSNLGPIHKADVELRPLTVLVGTPNSGKSYFSTLLYAIGAIRSSFLLQRPAENLLSRADAGVGDGYWQQEKIEEIREIVKWLESIERLEKNGERNELVKVPREIKCCFNRVTENGEALNGIVGKILNKHISPINASLNLLSQNSNEGSFSLINKQNSHLAKIIKAFDVTCIFDKRKYTTKTYFPDLVRLGDIDFNKIIPEFKNLHHDYKALTGEFPHPHQPRHIVAGFCDVLLHIINIFQGNVFESVGGSIHFLPAPRSNLIFHKNFYSTSELNEISNYEEHEGSILDPVFAKFLLNMGQFSDKPSLGNKGMKRLAQDLEAKILGGKVHFKYDLSGNGSYVFAPSNTENEISLSKASSMVSNLAPLVVYAKSILREGDTLIIEEPESHLHPRMQLEIVNFLARLVNLGIKVIVTTHSEWVAERLADLVFLAKLDKKKQAEIKNLKDPIDEEKVGVWEFRHNRKKSSSVARESKLNPDTGLYDLEFFKVAVESNDSHVRIHRRLEKSDNG